MTVALIVLVLLALPPPLAQVFGALVLGSAAHRREPAPAPPAAPRRTAIAARPPAREGRDDRTPHRTDILVLGAGGAGLLAALHAKDAAPQST